MPESTGSINEWNTAMPPPVEAVAEPSTGDPETDFRSAFAWFGYAIQETPDGEEKYTEMCRQAFAIFLEAMKNNGADSTHVERIVALNKQLMKDYQDNESR